MGSIAPQTRHARPCAGHPRLGFGARKTWMAGTSPAMTTRRYRGQHPTEIICDRPAAGGERERTSRAAPDQPHFIALSRRAALTVCRIDDCLGFLLGHVDGTCLQPEETEARKSRQRLERLQVFEERLLLLIAQGRAELMAASAVSRIDVIAIGDRANST